MQKKILLSLLVASPTALPALADVTITGAPDIKSWTPNGISSEFDIDVDAKKVNAGIGNGSVTQSLNNLPAGTYKLRFSIVSNCSVTVNGNTTNYSGINGNGIQSNVEKTITLAKAGKLTITIKAIDASKGFWFEDCTLSFSESYYKTAKNKFNKLTKPADLVKPASDKIGTDYAEALKNIESKYTEIDNIVNTNIAEVFPGQSEVATITELVENYNNYISDNNKLTKLIEEYNASVTSYNKDVTAANELAKIQEENNANKAEFEAALVGPDGEIFKELQNLKDRVKASEVDYAKNIANNTIKSFEEKELADYDELIKKTFVNVDSATEVISLDELNEAKSAILEGISNIGVQFDQDIADYNAYVALQTLKAELNFTYNDVTAKIQAFEGVKDYENVYDNVKSGWLSTVATILTKCQDETKLPVYSDAEGAENDLSGMADKLGTDEKPGAYKIAIEAAKAEMNDKYTEYEGIVKDQNDLFTATQTEVDGKKGYNARIQAATVEIVPTALNNAGYKKALDAANKAVKAYFDAQETDYKVQGLTDKSNADLNTKAENAVAALEKLASDYSGIIDLQKKFDEAKEGLAEPVKDKDGKVIIDIKAKFATTIVNIQAAIDKLTPANFNNEGELDKNAQNVYDAIERFVEEANLLHDVYTTTYENIEKYIESVDAFGGVIDKKLVVLESYDIEKYKDDTYQPIKDDADKFLTDLLAAANNSTPQTCYDAAKEIKDSFNGEKLAADLDATEKAFVKDVTDANYKAVNNKYGEVNETYNAKENVIGYETLLSGIQKVGTDLIDIQNKIVAAADAEDYVNAYGTEDTALNELASALKVISDNMLVLDKNKDNYDALVKLYDQVKENIENLNEDNKASVGVGKTYFEGVIAGLNKKLAALKEEIDTEYGNAGLDKDGKMLDGINDTEKEDFAEDLENLNTDAAKTSTNIAANNLAFSEQQLESAKTRTALQELYNQLDDYQKNVDGNAHAVAEVDEWLKEIQALIDSDMLEADKAVTDAYGKGLSATNNTDLIQKYEDILEQAKKIVKDHNDEYGGLVTSLNNNLLEKNDWSGTITALNAAYRSAIENYNFYLYRLTNEGYKAKLKETLDAESDLYDFSNYINELIESEGELWNSWNKTKAVIPQTVWDSEVQKPANELLTAIQNREKSLTDKVNAIAEAYYATLNSQCTTAIGDAIRLLTQVGIADSYIQKGLNEAVIMHGDAVSQYDEATKEGSKASIGREMDGIANKLDKVIPLIDLQSISQGAWADTYNEKVDEVKALEKEVKNLKNLGSYDETVFTNALTKLSQVNGLATKDEELIDSYTLYTGMLNDVLNDVKSYVNECKVQDAANQEVSDQLEAYLTDVEDLQKLLDEFTAYANRFSVAADFKAFEISSQADLNAIKEATSKFKGEYADWKAANDAAIASFKKSIEEEYDVLRKEEMKVLNAWVLKVRTAYDNAFEGDKTATTETMEGYNNRINTADAETVDLGVQYTSLNTNNSDFAEKAEGLLDDLTTIYSELKTQWPTYVIGDSTTDVLASLDDLYNTVDGAISLAQDELSGYVESVQNEYAPKFNDYKKQLDAIKAAYVAEGNKVLANYTDYESQLNALEDEVAKTVKAMQDANDAALEQAQKEAASDAQAAVLQTQLDDLKAKRDAAAVVIEGYGESDNDYVAGKLKQFDDAYTQLSEWLAENKKNHTLTDESTFNPSVETMEKYLLNAEYNAARYYGLDKQTSCYNKLYNEVNKALGEPNIVNKAALEVEFGKLETRYNNVIVPNSDKWTADRYETLKAAIAELESIMNDADALLNSIEESTYVPGDVVGEGNVITASDVMQIVNWILEGVTYDELLAENPRQAYAADLAEDQEINVTDVAIDIQLMFGDTSALAQRKLARFAAPAVEQNTSMGLMLVGEESGVRRYAITLDNTIPMIAGQFDLKLGSGARIANVSVAERDNNHEVQFQETANGARVVLYSMDNTEFDATSGAILYVDVEGSGKMSVDKAIVTDSYFKTHILNAQGTSFVDSIIENAKEAKTRIYNAAGVMFNKLQNGINIIRDSNGKVRKEYNRK